MGPLFRPHGPALSGFRTHTRRVLIFRGLRLPQHTRRSLRFVVRRHRQQTILLSLIMIRNSRRSRQVLQRGPHRILNMLLTRLQQRNSRHHTIMRHTTVNGVTNNRHRRIATPSFSKTHTVSNRQPLVTSIQIGLVLIRGILRNFFQWLSTRRLIPTFNRPRRIRTFPARQRRCPHTLLRTRLQPVPLRV